MGAAAQAAKQHRVVKSNRFGVAPPLKCVFVAEDHVVDDMHAQAGDAGFAADAEKDGRALIIIIRVAYNGSLRLGLL